MRLALELARKSLQRLSARYRIADLIMQEPEIEATVRRIYEERLLEGRQQ